MKRSQRVGKQSSADWVTAICSQISRGNYMQALRAFEKWADQQMRNPAGEHEYEIARGIYVILSCADFRLKEDFDTKWQKGKQLNTKTRAHERCGFCLKPRLEVATLLAGSSAYICDVCVRECFEVISEMKQPSRGNAPRLTNKKRKS